jgi:polysaccharide biosynthesis/export protein
MKRIYLLGILALVLSSCTTQNLFVSHGEEKQDIMLMRDASFLFNSKYEYRKRKDDKVNISVWGQDDLSVGSAYGIYNSNEVYGKWLLVDVNGNVQLPKIGTTHIEGYTVDELQDSLKAIYKKWIVTPVVTVKIQNKQISVMGEVRNPAVIEIDKDNNTFWVRIIIFIRGNNPHWHWKSSLRLQEQ